MTKTLWNDRARETLMRRLEKLSPETPPLWGRMNAGEMLAHVLLGAMNEAAMLVARAETGVAARRQATKAVDRLIDGFLRSS